MWSLVVGCSRSILHQEGFEQPKSPQQIRGVGGVSVSIAVAREFARAYHPAGEMTNQGFGLGRRGVQ